jgi:glycosyltransferase involved in cell wall biosynthesis
MDVSVIVPARDAQATLPRTLDALSRQEFEGEYEVLVVDDGSRDATATLARAVDAPVRVLSQPGRGPGAARNLGAAQSSAPALAFCDADVFPTQAWLRAGHQALAQADIVQGQVLPDPLAPLGPFDRTIWVTSPHGLWEAANMFVARPLFERLGGFSDGIRPRRGKVLGEDVFFGYSALRAGAASVFSPEALAYHAVFPRSWREYVAERRRLAYFPAMAREAPELRDGFLYRRLFLNPRTAHLDLALAAAGLAWICDSPLPLLAALPYLEAVRGHSRRSQRSAAARWTVALADVAADAVGGAAMAAGSLRHRSPVL